MYKKILFSFFFLSVMSLSFAEVVRYAALDVGSGKTKLTVGDVDLEKKEVVDVVLTEYEKIGFAEALQNSPDNTLDDGLLEIAVDKIGRLKQKAQEAGAVKIFGVATEAFRKADNGSDFIGSLSARVGLPLKIISQEQEALLGFETAVQASKKPRDGIVSWDSGGGSLQLTTLIAGEPAVYLIPYGTAPATRLLQELKGRDPESDPGPNPVTLREALSFIRYIHENLPDIDPGLRDKLRDPDTFVIGIGNFSSTIGVCVRASGKNVFTSKDLWGGIALLLNKSDAELEADYRDAFVATILPRLLLTYGVMTRLQVETIEWAETNGNGLGLLVADL